MPISSILSDPTDQENVAPVFLAAKDVAKAPAKPAAAGRKRKSTDALAPEPAVEINLDDIEVDEYINQNCDQVRRKINNFLDSGAMTKTAFAREIGVSAKSLSGFMGEHGAYKGSNYAAYGAAWEYFRKREIAGLKMPSKKQKTTAGGKAGAPAFNSAGVDISGIYLPGEETDSVPVYDTCDEVRRKINAHLKKDGVTQAQFCRDILAQLNSQSKPSNIQSSQLARFRGMKGPKTGCTSSVFYGAYVFFEKVRIKEGKPKSQHRLDMEMLWPNGFDREHDGRTPILCVTGRTPVMTKYGLIDYV